MSAVTPTGIVTASSTLVLAVTALITAVKGVIPLLRTARETKAAVGEVHELVNNRSDRQDARIEQLEHGLRDAGSAVPDRPALPE
jgi:hypothetical protein